MTPNANANANANANESLPWLGVYLSRATYRSSWLPQLGVGRHDLALGMAMICMYCKSLRETRGQINKFRIVRSGQSLAVQSTL